MYSVVALLGLALVSWLLVYGIRLWTQRLQILDVPNERSSHSQPVPRGGGIAIVVVTLAIGTWYASLHAFDRSVVAYLISGLLIAVISWLDDLRSIASMVRFACHVLAALLVIASLDLTLAWSHLVMPWWLVAPASLAWIVGLTNIYNFMDGIDGLAGSQAIVAGLWWAIISTLLGVPFVTMVALALTASNIGVLLHNWSPARIFMGDVGSAFLGYSFAVFPLFYLQSGKSWSVLIGGVLSVWPFLFDGCLTIVRRALGGENIFQAHRSHLYQRLVIQGWSHRTVTTLYIVYALLSAACAFVIVVRGWHWTIAGIPIALGVGLFFWVRHLERHPVRDAAILR